MSRLDDAFKPDFKALTSMVVGRPGSGKSFWLEHSIRDFMKSHKDPNFRLVYICPKHEMSLYDKSKPIGVDSLEKHLRKNRTAVVYPDPDYVEAEVDCGRALSVPSSIAIVLSFCTAMRCEASPGAVGTP